MIVGRCVASNVMFTWSNAAHLIAAALNYIH